MYLVVCVLTRITLHPPPRAELPPVATAADGTHPTGMHSCNMYYWFRSIDVIHVIRQRKPILSKLFLKISLSLVLYKTKSCAFCSLCYRSELVLLVPRFTFVINFDFTNLISSGEVRFKLTELFFKFKSS